MCTVKILKKCKNIEGISCIVKLIDSTGYSLTIRLSIPSADKLKILRYIHNHVKNILAGCVKCASNVLQMYSAAHRRIKRGGGGFWPPFSWTPPFSSVTPPSTQPDLTDKSNVNCFLIVMQFRTAFHWYSRFKVHVSSFFSI